MHVYSCQPERIERESKREDELRLGGQRWREREREGEEEDDDGEFLLSSLPSTGLGQDPTHLTYLLHVYPA